MLIEIKNRWSRNVVVSGEFENYKTAIELFLRDADLYDADLYDADLSFVPKIDSLDAKIFSAIQTGGILEMSTWHTCDTTHCRAGWAIHLAGDFGKMLETIYGSCAAGALIYQANTGRIPNFYASNEDALADIKKCALEQIK